MVQLYKNQFQFTHGVENVQRVKLRKDAPLERLYATCCGTPIGFTIAKSVPLFVVYYDLLTFTSATEFVPLGWRFYTSRVPAIKHTWKGKETAEASENVALSFMFRAASRVMYGMIMGFNRPDPMDAVNEPCEVIGM
jgi:hypothetical protein